MNIPSRHIQEDLKSGGSTHVEQFHVFSTFFYSKIIQNSWDPEKCYQDVHRWTRRVNIFEKKYLIIPVNLHDHWFLAIITNPKFMLCTPSPIDVDNATGQDITPSDAHIITLDSLNGSHAHVVKKLIEYLRLEARDKLDKEIIRAPKEWKVAVWLLRYHPHLV
ncbi:hypothetical protein BD779DRAFT_761499 [Infundibulicybe gibba]|nr:hypothetical protein BD779DRAFT_761499 [Infundibulicybe gibba]